MAKKRKKRGPNVLQIKIKKVTLPKGTTTAQYLAGLKKALRTQELPDGWEVDLAWRNPNTLKGRTKNWQQGEFTDTLRASRKGFTTVVRKILAQHMAELPPAPAKKKTAAKKTAKKTAAQQELFAPTRAEKLSAAAKKGWITRRARQVKLI